MVDNHGWTSVRNLQVDKYDWDRVIDTEFDDERAVITGNWDLADFENK